MNLNEFVGGQALKYKFDESTDKCRSTLCDCLAGWLTGYDVGGAAEETTTTTMMGM